MDVSPNAYYIPNQISFKGFILDHFVVRPALLHNVIFRYGVRWTRLRRESQDKGSTNKDDVEISHINPILLMLSSTNPMLSFWVQADSFL
jgi:hypothetical protein